MGSVNVIQHAQRTFAQVRQQHQPTDSATHHASASDPMSASVSSPSTGTKQKTVCAERPASSLLPRSESTHGTTAPCCSKDKQQNEVDDPMTLRLMWQAETRSQTRLCAAAHDRLELAAREQRRAEQQALQLDPVAWQHKAACPSIQQRMHGGESERRRESTDKGKGEQNGPEDRLEAVGLEAVLQLLLRVSQQAGVLSIDLNIHANMTG